MPSSASLSPPRPPLFPYTTLFRSDLSGTGVRVGSPIYMAPEQHRGEPASAAADQFAFCVALYEGLHGARPFAGDTLDELAANVLAGDRKSTRLNSSHLGISYAVFCFPVTPSTSTLSLHDALPI